MILSLLTLTLLEIVLGIDNVIFITLLVNKLPLQLRKRGRLLGLSFAMITRLGLLCTLSWMATLTEPIITLYSLSFSGRDLILLIGGGFLIYKSLLELLQRDSEHKNEKPDSTSSTQSAPLFWFVMGQIALIDIVFSLDSIITAVGLVNEIPIMMSAIVLSVFIMMFALKPISDLLEKYPSFKILALCFLVLIGSALMLEGCHVEIEKSYIYGCIGFAVIYETLRLKSMPKHK